MLNCTVKSLIYTGTYTFLWIYSATGIPPTPLSTNIQVISNELCVNMCFLIYKYMSPCCH